MDRPEAHICQGKHWIMFNHKYEILPEVFSFKILSSQKNAVIIHSIFWKQKWRNWKYKFYMQVYDCDWIKKQNKSSETRISNKKKRRTSKWLQHSDQECWITKKKKKKQSNKRKTSNKLILPATFKVICRSSKCRNNFSKGLKKIIHCYSYTFLINRFSEIIKT